MELAVAQIEGPDGGVCIGFPGLGYRRDELRGQGVEGHQAVEEVVDDLDAFGFLGVPRIDGRLVRR